MPNHCHNNLWLRGDEDAVQDFINKVKIEEGSEIKYEICNTFLPTPAELREEPAMFGTPKDEDEAKRQQLMIDKYGHKNWYDWNIANWGTKWGDYETYLSEADDGTPMFGFTSAWGPPTEAIAKIAAMFPDVWFIHYYSEEGMGFYGLDSYEDGELIIEDCENYDDIPGYEEMCSAEDYDGAWSKVREAMIELLNRHGYDGLIESELEHGPKGF